MDFLKAINSRKNSSTEDKVNKYFNIRIFVQILIQKMSKHILNLLVSHLFVHLEFVEIHIQTNPDYWFI